MAVSRQHSQARPRPHHTHLLPRVHLRAGDDPCGGTTSCGSSWGMRLRLRGAAADPAGGGLPPQSVSAGGQFGGEAVRVSHDGDGVVLRPAADGRFGGSADSWASRTDKKKASAPPFIAVMCRGPLLVCEVGVGNYTHGGPPAGGRNSAFAALFSVIRLLPASRWDSTARYRILSVNNGRSNHQVGFFNLLQGTLRCLSQTPYSI
jgi:hypothetical protein